MLQAKRPSELVMHIEIGSKERGTVNGLMKS